jgi:hypothetical protein
VVLVVVVVVVTIVLISSDDPGSVQASETATPTKESRGKNVPCRHPNDADQEPKAPGATPPTAYAKGGTGSVELIRHQRQLIVFDRLSDGCSIIVTAKADGAETGTWASTLGKTGKIKKGLPTPPKVIPDGWPEGSQRIEFRACYGEVVGGEIVFEESACGDWVIARLDTSPT